MINFKAKFITTVPVSKLDTIKNTYQPENTNFIELDLNSYKDIETVSKIANLWGQESFADNIAYNVKQTLKNESDKAKINVYALTTQTKDFSKIDINKILALAEIEKLSNTNIFLEYLQVAPKFVYTTTKALFKGCGSAVLRCLKAKYNDKSIFLNSRIEHFYTKNGFIKIEQNKYFWSKFLK